jgi:FdhD protein
LETKDTDSIHSVEAMRVSTADGQTVPELCRVVVEQPFTITIDGVGSYTLMRTPCDTMALAVGFAFTEGIISGTADIDLLNRCEDDPSSVRIRLSHLPDNAQNRNMIVSSSCGLCGSADVDAMLESLPKVGDSFRASASQILAVFREMKSRQAIFEQTGGAHAAAIFASDGDIVAFAEDIGRHNALDKAIGKCLLENKPTAGCAAAVSGRLSLELVAKAARAGAELIAAVSAPSSFAITAADHAGITLCGFARGDRLTVYSRPARVTETADEHR